LSTASSPSGERPPLVCTLTRRPQRTLLKWRVLHRFPPWTKPSRGLAMTDRWGVVLRMSMLWRRLPSGLVSPWCCTGKNTLSQHSPVTPSAAFVRRHPKEGGHRRRLAMASRAAPLPQIAGLGRGRLGRRNPGIQEYRDAEWQGHDRSRDVLSSSRSVDGASRHHKLKDGGFMSVRRRRRTPVTDHAVAG